MCRPSRNVIHDYAAVFVVGRPFGVNCAGAGAAACAGPVRDAVDVAAVPGRGDEAGADVAAAVPVGAAGPSLARTDAHERGGQRRRGGRRPALLERSVHYIHTHAGLHDVKFGHLWVELPANDSNIRSFG